MELLITVILGVAALVIGLVAWLRPRAPKQVTAPHQTARVEVANCIPVYDLPDGSTDLGEHFIGVTVLNGESAPVRVMGWGLLLPGNRRMVVTRPQTNFEPRLPHWVDPGDQAQWFLDADEVRRQQATLGCKFDDMIAYVSLADGRELKAPGGVPLA